MPKTGFTYKATRTGYINRGKVDAGFSLLDEFATVSFAFTVSVFVGEGILSELGGVLKV